MNTDRLGLLVWACFCLLLIYSKFGLGQHSLYAIIGVAGLILVGWKAAKKPKEMEE